MKCEFKPQGYKDKQSKKRRQRKGEKALYDYDLQKRNYRKDSSCFEKVTREIIGKSEQGTDRIKICFSWRCEKLAKDVINSFIGVDCEVTFSEIDI